MRSFILCFFVGSFFLSPYISMAQERRGPRFAREAKPETADSLKSNYKYTEVFANGFYSNPGSPTRSASGKPGHEYWQNEARDIF